jgi:hypothetical protein
MTNTKENKIVAEYYTPLKTRQPSELQQFNSYLCYKCNINCFTNGNMARDAVERCM